MIRFRTPRYRTPGMPSWWMSVRSSTWSYGMPRRSRAAKISRSSRRVRVVRTARRPSRPVSVPTSLPEVFLDVRRQRVLDRVDTDDLELGLAAGALQDLHHPNIVRRHGFHAVRAVAHR